MLDFLKTLKEIKTNKITTERIIITIVIIMEISMRAEKGTVLPIKNLIMFNRVKII
jgi:hypothetical protein